MAFFILYPLSALGHDISPRADRPLNVQYQNQLHVVDNSMTYIKGKMSKLQRHFVYRNLLDE